VDYSAANRVLMLIGLLLIICEVLCVRSPAIAKQKMLNTSLATMTVEDFAVDIPDLPPDLSDWSEYDKASDW